jgi:hypothetical protein
MEFLLRKETRKPHVLKLLRSILKSSDSKMILFYANILFPPLYTHSKVNIIREQSMRSRNITLVYRNKGLSNSKFEKIA